MKIFMLIKWLHYSGAPKMFLWVAKSLASRGYDVTIFTYMEGSKIELPSNITHIHYNLEDKGIIGKIKYIRKVIKDIKADISISFLLDANVYNTFACFGLKTKSIICERNDPFKPGYYKLWLWKPFFRLADGGVFQLKKVREYYSNIKHNSVVIPNPVSVPNISLNNSLFDRKKKITSVGRLDIFQKRQDLLIKAFSIFSKSHPDYTLNLYGDGPDETKLRKIAEEEGVSNRVIFEGVTDLPLKSISDSQFFVLSSDFEGIPNSLIEAMSIGLPCIATDCRPGGADFLIENNANGILTPQGDIISLAEAMNYLVSHPNEADKMGQEAKKISSNLSEKKIGDKWMQYIESVH